MCKLHKYIELTLRNDTGRPKEYIRGPDVMSKSKRTQRRYRNVNRNQMTLDSFVFAKNPTHTSATKPMRCHSHVTMKLEPVAPSLRLESRVNERENIREESVEVEIPPAIRQESIEVEIPPAIRQESVEVQIPPLTSRNDEGVCPTDDTEDEITGDGWECDIDECVRAGAEIRGWDKLRDQIKEDLKKGAKTLPMSKINQLLILRNFATLLLKGLGWIKASSDIACQWKEGEGKHFARKVRALARHYQVFEQLPREKRGGEKEARSPLFDERVKRAACGWLTSQAVGQVSPRRFQEALNVEILPSLSIELKRPLCERTARRWLLKLGWRLTMLKKGVYMDGHEREDVVKYRNEVFLPAMARFEERMTHFEGPTMTQTPPTLKDGEKEVIPQFHDESCLTVNDFKAKAWLGPGQTILQKKGRGRLIHVSEFINPITGRLVLQDKDGNVVDEARKVIYPGSNGDPWWDTEQLLAQVKHAIQVFKKAHPNCIALFIFDQSSAHASLGPDALRSSEMNKSDGGKQRKQRDTVIPDSNPFPEHRGKVQRMTLPDGTPKGLERVLTERGFDVRRMRAKCAPVCPWENTDCCMMRLLSKQDDFVHQESMLETLIKKSGHECLFLPKFHCELNPIEMVCHTVFQRLSFSHCIQVLGLG